MGLSLRSPDLISLPMTWKQESRICLSDLYLMLKLGETPKDRNKNSNSFANRIKIIYREVVPFIMQIQDWTQHKK